MGVLSENTVSSDMPPPTQLPPIETNARKRRRKKKRIPKNENSEETINSESLTDGRSLADGDLNMTTGTNLESEIGEQSIMSEKESEMSQMVSEVNIDQRLQNLAKIEEELIKRDNLVISVGNVGNLHKPQSVKDWTMTNAMVQPTHDGKLYVQTKHGFQERNLNDDTKPKKSPTNLVN